MAKENFKFLDSSEKRFWSVLDRANVKYKVSDDHFDPTSRRIVKTPDMHHYEFDQFYDSYGLNEKNANKASQFHDAFASNYAQCPQYDPMPNINRNNGEERIAGELGLLSDVEKKGIELEKEISALGDKIISYFYESRKTVANVDESFCSLNVLAGVKAKCHTNIIETICSRFDEKLSSIQFHLTENKIAKMISDLQKKHEEATKAAHKLLEEVKKLK